MTNHDHESLIGNQGDILAGVEDNPASVIYHTEGNINRFNYHYTPHNVSQTQLSSNSALSLPQHDRIRARLAQTQQLTNDLTQVFNLNTISSYQHQGTQSTPSLNQPPSFQQPHYEINFDLPLQSVQHGPVVDETATGNFGAPFDANLLQPNPTFGALSSSCYEVSNSHLNVLATPFYPHSYAANELNNLTEQNTIPQVTGGPLQDIERDEEYHPSAGDYASTWPAPWPHSNNIQESIDEMKIDLPYNNPLGLSGPASAPFSPQPGGDELATPSSSQQAYNAPYTQYIDNDTAFTDGMLYSPLLTTAPSRVSTSISGAGSHHEYPPSSFTPSTSIRQSRSIHSRTTGRDNRRATSLSRSTSAQTNFSLESNGSGPSRRGRRNGPMDPNRNRQAQETRIQQLVCADCKLRKVQCKRNGDHETCDACKKKGVPCVKHFFSRDLKTLPEYQFGLFLIKAALLPGVVRDELTQRMDFVRSIDILAFFSQYYNVRIQSSDVWCDLNLAACHDHWQQAKLDYKDPEDHCMVEDFVTNKHRWQDTMKCHALLLVPTSTSENIWNDPLKAFARLDRMSGQETYTLIPKSASPSGTRPFDLRNDSEKKLYVIARLTFERIRHYMELDAYSCLEQELAPGRANENTRVVSFLGLMLLSLRRRIAICKVTKVWTLFQNDPLARYLGSGQGGSTEPYVIKKMVAFCFQLYTHFFCRYPKLSSVSKGAVLGGQTTIHPLTRMATREYLPTDASKHGFYNWMADGDELMGNGVI